MFSTATVPDHGEAFTAPSLVSLGRRNSRVAADGDRDAHGADTRCKSEEAPPPARSRPSARPSAPSASFERCPNGKDVAIDSATRQRRPAVDNGCDLNGDERDPPSESPQARLRAVADRVEGRLPHLPPLHAAPMRPDALTISLPQLLQRDAHPRRRPPSPCASSLWFRSTPSSSIRRHSRARHPTGFRSFFSPTSSLERRLRTNANDVAQVLATQAPGAPRPLQFTSETIGFAALDALLRVPVLDREPSDPPELPHVARHEHPSRSRNTFNAMLTAAIDTPSPRASSRWLRPPPP